MQIRDHMLRHTHTAHETVYTKHTNYNRENWDRTVLKKKNRARFSGRTESTAPPASEAAATPVFQRNL